MLKKLHWFLGHQFAHENYDIVYLENCVCACVYIRSAKESEPEWNHMPMLGPLGPHYTSKWCPAGASERSTLLFISWKNDHVCVILHTSCIHRSIVIALRAIWSCARARQSCEGWHRNPRGRIQHVIETSSLLLSLSLYLSLSLSSYFLAQSLLFK